MQIPRTIPMISTDMPFEFKRHRSFSEAFHAGYFLVYYNLSNECILHVVYRYTIYKLRI